MAKKSTPPSLWNRSAPPDRINREVNFPKIQWWNGQPAPPMTGGMDEKAYHAMAGSPVYKGGFELPLEAFPYLEGIKDLQGYIETFPHQEGASKVRAVAFPMIHIAVIAVGVVWQSGRYPNYTFTQDYQPGSVSKMNALCLVQELQQHLAAYQPVILHLTGMAAKDFFNGGSKEPGLYQIFQRSVLGAADGFARQHNPEHSGFADYALWMPIQRGEGTQRGGNQKSWATPLIPAWSDPITEEEILTLAVDDDVYAYLNDVLYPQGQEWLESWYQFHLGGPPAALPVMDDSPLDSEPLSGPPAGPDAYQFKLLPPAFFRSPADALTWADDEASSAGVQIFNHARHRENSYANTKKEVLADYNFPGSVVPEAKLQEVATRIASAWAKKIRAKIVEALAEQAQGSFSVEDPF